MTDANNFYNDFDQTLLHSSKERKLHSRTPFQQDRDRIIYSSSFRRLQAKTQVFFSGEYDFYRTRLTHSIEVSQIGRSICHHLIKTSPYLKNEYYIDPDLVEAVCLSHDIGHPPFGHAGESALHQLMKDYGGFEGNAQTLRIITETIFSSSDGRTGMNPTRAFADGVMKYKSGFSDSKSNGCVPKNHFIYDDQQSLIQFIFELPSLSSEFQLPDAMNSFRSIECQIMDWADDTAFSINDVVDGVASGLITAQKIEVWASRSDLSDEESGMIVKLLNSMKSGSLQKRFAMKIGDMINACSLEPVQNFMSAKTNRYAFHLKIDPIAQTETKLYSRLSRELVFRSPQIYQLEFKAEQMLKKLFAAFHEHYLAVPKPRMSLLPNDTERMILQETVIPKRARLICDYISGMTDVFAIRTYKRLFDPDFGSIGDLI
jgi:dGTPase